MLPCQDSWVSQIDIHLPYCKPGRKRLQWTYPFDETVVNPFLQSHEVPASRGPFLSVFRRSVSFEPDTRAGVRDKIGFDALLGFIDVLSLAELDDSGGLSALPACRLRSPARCVRHCPAACQRLSWKVPDTPCAVGTGFQWRTLSGFLTVAMFQTIREAFKLDWDINWQGINVADRASEVAGDITISLEGSAILTVEVADRRSIGPALRRRSAIRYCGAI